MTGRHCGKGRCEKAVMGEKSVRFIRVCVGVCVYVCTSRRWHATVLLDGAFGKPHGKLLNGPGREIKREGSVKHRNGEILRPD